MSKELIEELVQDKLELKQQQQFLLRIIGYLWDQADTSGPIKVADLAEYEASVTLDGGTVTIA